MDANKNAPTVLVVDKFHGISFVIEGALKATHAKYIFSNSVREAMTAFDGTEISLVISGYYLNDGTGLDVLKYIRQLKKEKEVPFVLYTNLLQHEVPHVSYLSFHYVHKSKFKELAQVVTSILEGSSMKGVS